MKTLRKLFLKYEKLKEKSGNRKCLFSGKSFIAWPHIHATNFSKRIYQKLTLKKILRDNLVKEYIKGKIFIYYRIFLVVYMRIATLPAIKLEGMQGMGSI